MLSLLVIYRFTKDAIVGSNSISAIEIQHLKAPILNNDLQQFKKPKHIFNDRDPNNWDSIDWESIGLSKNQVQTLLNYKDAIGLSKYMEEQGLGTKILPEAFDWDFAGSWFHIFNGIDYYKFIDYLSSAISYREYSKFIFTKYISLILELIYEFGKKYKLAPV